MDFSTLLALKCVLPMSKNTKLPLQIHYKHPWLSINFFYSLITFYHLLTYIWKNAYISSKAKAHYNIIFSINDTEKYAKQSFTHRHTHAQTKPNSHTHTHSTQGKGWCVCCTIFQPDNSHSTFSLVFWRSAPLFIWIDVTDSLITPSRHV